MRIFSVFLILSAIILRADPIISTGVSCQAYGYSPETAVSSCSQGTRSNTYPPYASANSSASVALQQTASDFLSVSMMTNTYTIDGLAYYQNQGE